ncbi:hypothetical protein AN396_11700 [Candidatus Epulonipiscium fishelsonii]|uniref:Uncharacterized protein n=1 Tax=Candidatus Epulonipiscium fishelsonii TaxID=77094 RepID=A0ACC8X7Z3_9FIRM|nr:hypothetical protein AN396_11700 [Epulopiscium sp. SCG-B11WGA-EpuloA1]
MIQDIKHFIAIHLKNDKSFKVIKGLEAFFTEPRYFFKLVRLRYYGSIKKYKKYPQHKFYVIANAWRSGFFASFNYVLKNLIIADIKGYIPIIDMQNYKTLYNEDYKFKNTFNAWEYYFYQPTKISLNEVYKSKNVKISGNGYSEIEVPLYKANGNKKPTKKQIEQLNCYIKKYIKIKPYVEDIVQRTQKDFSQFNKIVGVHVRATDMYTEGGHHPIPPGLQRIIPRIDFVLKKYGVDGIFVCTDDTGSLEILQKRYGSKIICTNSVRANKGSNTGIHHDKSLSNRKNHKYLLGLEVLVDMLLLSRCNLLIGGHSSVTYTAMMFNNNQYKKVYLLENRKD